MDKEPDYLMEAIKGLEHFIAAATQLNWLIAYLTECRLTGRKGPFNAPLNPASTAAEALAQHRRNHRSGHPAKIDSDPELRAFILARLDTMTLGDIVTDLATTFPPNRRVSRSSVHRWWQKHRTNLLVPPPPNRE